MSSTCGLEFESWLSKLLLSLNEDTDVDVFVSYIVGVLDTDTEESEKREAIIELLAQCAEDGLEALCDTVVDHWKKTHKTVEATSTSKGKFELDLSLASILEKQQLSVIKGDKQNLSEEEKSRKAAILAQYAQISDGDDDDDDEQESSADGATAANCDKLLVRNTNASLVKERELQQREKSRAESELKKRKDKEDREKQKEKEKERKESEKKRTQKGERKR